MVALVLGLQVHAPLHRELELRFGPLENLDRLVVAHAHELRVDDALELRDHAFLDALLEKSHVVGPLAEQGFDDVFQKGFCEIGIRAEVGEGDLGLDHPELGEVAAGVRVLRAEGRPEGVDPREREAVCLDVELPRDGEEGLAAEEVLAVVDAPRLGARQVGEIERGDAEQRAGALGVGRGDDRRVDPEEALLVEEAVDRLGDRVAHARHRADHVGARPQVRHLAQELELCGFGWIG
jgi:hypothetical protein